MMKNVFLIIFILINIDLFSQDVGHAIYNKQSNLQFSSDTLDLKMKYLLTESNKKIEKLSYKLKFDKSISVYQEIEKINSGENTSIRISKILSGFKGIVYLDNNLNKIISIKEISGKTFYIENEVSDFEWKISNEKSKIGKYNCIKATTFIEKEGRSGVRKIPVEAWFAPDINVQHGPDGFGGLPGLIIKIKKENIVTTLSEINFRKLDSKIVLPNENTISQEDFNSLMKEISLNRRKYYNKN